MSTVSKGSKVLPILFFTLLLDTISIGILIPVLPAIFTNPESSSFILGGYSVGAQYIIAGAITAVFGLMQFLAAPLLGELSDIYGRKKLLTLGVGLLALSNLVFGFGVEVASLTLLFVSRIVAGLAGANFSIAQASIADVSKPEERAKNFGLIGGAFGLGFIFGPLLGGWISHAFGNPAFPFWFAGLLGLVNLVFISLFLPETRTVEKRVRATFDIWKGFKNIATAAKDKDASPVYLTSFLYMSGFSFFTSFISILLAIQYNFTESAIGTFFGVLGAVITVTQFFILGRLTKIYKERQILLVGIPIVATCVLLYPFVGGAPWVYILIPLMAIPQGLAFANISSLVSKSVSPDKQGAALGINGSLMALAQGTVPLLAGIGSGIVGLRLPFIAGSLLMVVAWTVLKTSKRKVA
ncbi:MAG: MFS transporter [Candidatus Pacebacteria bacterium]|nr:MFS transporter [Candidatus Paceibacterota bacterium]